jgi:hypothetical protein
MTLLGILAVRVPARRALLVNVSGYEGPTVGCRYIAKSLFDEVASAYPRRQPTGSY